MILEFGTLRSECVLNASEGVSTRNGELESQVEFHNSIPIPYWASSNLHAINVRACLGLVLSQIW